MPSSPHPSPAMDGTFESPSLQAHAERPVMDRKASGAFRQLTNEKKGVKGKKSHSSLKDDVVNSQDTRFEASQTLDMEPVVEMEVDEMMSKGTIEVGVLQEEPAFGKEPEESSSKTAEVMDPANFVGDEAEDTSEVEPQLILDVEEDASEVEHRFGTGSEGLAESGDGDDKDALKPSETLDDVSQPSDEVSLSWWARVNVRLISDHTKCQTSRASREIQLAGHTD